MAEYKGIKGFKVQSLASDPTVNEGQIWYNTASYALKYDAVGAGSWSSAPVVNTIEISFCKIRYFSNQEKWKLTPLQNATSFILGNALFKEILLLSKIHDLTHPRKRVMDIIKFFKPNSF